MENKTYFEILAENDSEARQDYAINPKELFVEHNDVPSDQELEGDDHHEHTELENKEAFQQFGGSRHEAGAPPKLIDLKSEDYLKNSILYEKNVRTHVINIDSRFRTEQSDPSTNFNFKLLKVMRNIISLRISSIEFPNTYYTFSKARGNLSFDIYYPKLIGDTFLTKQTITISEGNYEPTELVDLLNTLIPAQISITFNHSQGKIEFNSQKYFEIDTLSNNLSFVKRSQDNGLGYNLGLRQTFGSGNLKAISEFGGNGNNIPNFKIKGTGIIDTIDNNYIFISLEPDWKVVLNQTKDREMHFSFAKIIIDVPKGSILYDNGANTITKEYWFQQPTDITIIPIRVSDPYDQTIDLMGMDFSFSLEMKEVRNASLHESIRSK